MSNKRESSPAYFGDPLEEERNSRRNIGANTGNTQQKNDVKSIDPSSFNNYSTASDDEDYVLKKPTTASSNQQQQGSKANNNNSGKPRTIYVNPNHVSPKKVELTENFETAISPVILHEICQLFEIN